MVTLLIKNRTHPVHPAKSVSPELTHLIRTPSRLGLRLQNRKKLKENIKGKYWFKTKPFRVLL